MDERQIARLARLREGLKKGFSATLGVELEEVTDTGVTMTVDIGPQHLQPFGLVHGGVLASIVETACSIGANLHTPPGETVVGVENQTSFLRPAKGGRLTATARPLHVGQKSQLWETHIEDEANKLIAAGRLRLLNVKQAG